MSYYRDNWEKYEFHREMEHHPDMIRVSAELLDFVETHSIGPKNFRGRPLIEVDVLDHDTVRVVARRDTLIHLTQGEGSGCETSVVTLEARKPFKLVQASIFIPDYPRQRLLWASPGHLPY